MAQSDITTVITQVLKMALTSALEEPKKVYSRVRVYFDPNENSLEEPMTEAESVGFDEECLEIVLGYKSTDVAKDACREFFATTIGYVECAAIDPDDNTAPSMEFRESSTMRLTFAVQGVTYQVDLISETALPAACFDFAPQLHLNDANGTTFDLVQTDKPRNVSSTRSMTFSDVVKMKNYEQSVMAPSPKTVSFTDPPVVNDSEDEDDDDDTAAEEERLRQELEERRIQEEQAEAQRQQLIKQQQEAFEQEQIREQQAKLEREAADRRRQEQEALLAQQITASREKIATNELVKGELESRFDVLLKQQADIDTSIENHRVEIASIENQLAGVSSETLQSQIQALSVKYGTMALGTTATEEEKQAVCNEHALLSAQLNDRNAKQQSMNDMILEVNKLSHGRSEIDTELEEIENQINAQSSLLDSLNQSLTTLQLQEVPINMPPTEPIPTHGSSTPAVSHKVNLMD